MSKKINTITILKSELDELLVQLNQETDLDQSIAILEVANKKLALLKQAIAAAKLKLNKIILSD